MRTSEERVQELHERMGIMRNEKRRRKYMMQCTAGGAACFAVMMILAIIISNIPVQDVPGSQDGISASIFADHMVLGYIMIALVAFCLGASFTIFCFRLKKHMEERDD